MEQQNPSDAGTGDVAATPAAEAHASELGVDLSQVEGTGADGKITKADVAAAADTSSTTSSGTTQTEQLAKENVGSGNFPNTGAPSADVGSTHMVFCPPQTGGCGFKSDVANAAQAPGACPNCGHALVVLDADEAATTPGLGVAPNVVSPPRPQ